MKLRFFLFLLVFSSLSADSESAELEFIDDQKIQPSDVHGFFDLSLKNAYMTPRGLLVVNTDLTIQAAAGLSWDVYKNPCGFIQKATLSTFCWNDIWTHQKNTHAAAWVEFDWGLGFVLSFLDRWKFGAQYVQFLSPPGNFYPENNIEFLLAYDDDFLNPYAKLFWAVSGDSTVVVGRQGDTFDVELGLIPTFKGDYTVLFPTWLTIGPPSFWDGGPLALPHHRCILGVFSTGVDVRFPLACIPKRLGLWNFTVGGQYYYLFNRNLLYAQNFTLNNDRGYRHVGVVHLGLGFNF